MSNDAGRGGARFHGDTISYRLWTAPPLREADIGRS